MEFCELKLKQLDHETADIKVAVNIETLETLLRKNRPRDVFLWYEGLGIIIHEKLVTEFGAGPESVGDISIRTLRGHNTAGIPFVSVVVLVKVLPEGGNLTRDLTEIILQKIEEEMAKPPAMVPVTTTKFNQKKVSFEVEFDRAALSLEPSFLDDFIAVVKQALEDEIRKEYRKI